MNTGLKLTPKSTQMKILQPSNETELHQQFIIHRRTKILLGGFY